MFTSQYDKHDQSIAHDGGQGARPQLKLPAHGTNQPQPFNKMYDAIPYNPYREQFSQADYFSAALHASRPTFASHNQSQQPFNKMYAALPYNPYREQFHQADYFNPSARLDTPWASEAAVNNGYASGSLLVPNNNIQLFDLAAQNGHKTHEDLYDAPDHIESDESTSVKQTADHNDGSPRMQIAPASPPKPVIAPNPHVTTGKLRGRYTASQEAKFTEMVQAGVSDELIASEFQNTVNAVNTKRRRMQGVYSDPHLSDKRKPAAGIGWARGRK